MVSFDSDVLAHGPLGETTHEALRDASSGGLLAASSNVLDDFSESSFDLNGPASAAEEGSFMDAFENEEYFMSQMEMSFRGGDMMAAGDSGGLEGAEDVMDLLMEEEGDPTKGMNDIFVDARNQMETNNATDVPPENLLRGDSVPSLNPSETSSDLPADKEPKVPEEHPDVTIGKGMIKGVMMQGGMMLGIPYLMGFITKIFRNSQDDDVAAVANQAGPSGLDNSTQEVVNTSRRQLMMQQAGEESSRRGAAMAIQ